jgi:hypothetical protein
MREKWNENKHIEGVAESIAWHPIHYAKLEPPTFILNAFELLSYNASSDRHKSFHIRNQPFRNGHRCVASTVCP